MKLGKAAKLVAGALIVVFAAVSMGKSQNKNLVERLTETFDKLDAKDQEPKGLDIEEFYKNYESSDFMDDNIYLQTFDMTSYWLGPVKALKAVFNLALLKDGDKILEDGIISKKEFVQILAQAGSKCGYNCDLYDRNDAKKFLESHNLPTNETTVENIARLYAMEDANPGTTKTILKVAELFQL